MAELNTLGAPIKTALEALTEGNKLSVTAVSGAVAGVGVTKVEKVADEAAYDAIAAAPPADFATTFYVW